MNEPEINRLVSPLILVGGDSRAAAAIAARNAGRRIVSIARRDGPGERIATDDYRSVPGGVPFEDATIVNCVGTDRGDAATLEALNIAVPIAWAQAAAAGGARQFIQISSFSVYGRRTRIDHDSPLDPTSDYGRSRRDADAALAKLPGIAISALRVPILVSLAGAAGTPDKLAQLAGLAARAHLVPAPSRAVARAMISYDAMARAVALLEADPRPLAIAADPQPFTYDLLAQVAREAGVSMARIPVPGVASALLARVAPGIADRLFASSVLAPEANLLTGHGDFLRLTAVIASHFAG